MEKKYYDHPEGKDLDYKERNEIFYAGARTFWNGGQRSTNPYTGLRGQIWENGYWFAEHGGDKDGYLD